MHQYKGRLIVHTGSMFSGKTSSLEKDIKRFKIAGYNTVAFKPTLDTRYNKDTITTHDNTMIEALPCPSIETVLEYVAHHDVDVIGIDEVQFLEGELTDILNAVDHILKLKKTVVVAGLDMDFEGNPFAIVKELMPRADYLTKHHAVCTCCGADAWVSHRKSADKSRIVIGAAEEYEPLCRNCYNELIDKETNNSL
ncbi:thymidine kinase [Peptoniphilus equinus]|uniref:Thymidine kinase n=1 Tax=Peptoniphilus equinus TaxID=3016343 RepID=A0ABY7QWS3_9FIRM|nr:thymidine kinase [Peptoniphilus equinus]WBW50549.1 thymidine kinase [Peptoniphilus equinus]